jgi:hypothetical protein
LLSGLRVVLRLHQREPTEDTHELMGGRSVLGGNDSASFPKSVS